jgi:hypothetical protein
MRRVHHATTDAALYAALCAVPHPGPSVIALAALDETCDCMLQRQAFPTLASLQQAVRTARRTHALHLSRKTTALYLRIAQSIAAADLLDGTLL